MEDLLFLDLNGQTCHADLHIFLDLNWQTYHADLYIFSFRKADLPIFF